MIGYNYEVNNHIPDFFGARVQIIKKSIWEGFFVVFEVADVNGGNSETISWFMGSRYVEPGFFLQN